MRLKELSFPAMKLSALIAIEGKKFIVAMPLFTPTLHIDALLVIFYVIYFLGIE